MQGKVLTAEEKAVAREARARLAVARDKDGYALGGATCAACGHFTLDAGGASSTIPDCPACRGEVADCPSSGCSCFVAAEPKGG
jgi:hypothetical protein